MSAVELCDAQTANQKPGSTRGTTEGSIRRLAERTIVKTYRKQKRTKDPLLLFSKDGFNKENRFATFKITEGKLSLLLSPQYFIFDFHYS